MELCDGSMEDLFTLPGYNGADWVVPVGTAVLTGLVDLHADRGAVHGDLRNPANVLYIGGRADRLNPEAYTFKMADLGATKRWDNSTPENPETSTRPSLRRNCATLRVSCWRWPLAVWTTCRQSPWIRLTCPRWYREHLGK